MNQFKKNLIFIFIIILTCLQTGCKNQDSNKSRNVPLKTARTTLKPSVTNLYYNATIQPISVRTIVSPADGSVEQIEFKYGEKIAKDQALLILSSPKYQEDYRNAISEYLKARDGFAKAAEDFNATKILYSAKIIPEQEYMSQKSNYETANLTLINAGFTLKKSLANIRGVDEKEIQNLKLDDISNVKRVLERQHDQIEIISPADGVVLFPDKSSDSDTKSAKDLTVGSEIKKGDLLVAVGDLNGLALTLQIEEANINNIKVGDKVIVTPAAFSDIDLTGYIKSVGSQAKTSNEGGMANFPAIVNVPQLSEKAKKIIRVGMSAKVKITINHPPHITVPVAAVFEKNGESLVTIIDPETKQQKNVQVDTGTISATEVQILDGLKEGTEVVLHD